MCYSENRNNSAEFSERRTAMKMKKAAAFLLSAAILTSSVTPAVFADAVTGEAVRQLTEQNAFRTAWDDITGALSGGYEKVYNVAAGSVDAASLPALRLSLEPDALQLLDLASRSVLKTDLEWIEEAGIDLIPSGQEVTYSYTSRYLDGQIGEQNIMLPGLCAVLHVNGKEIASADMFPDPGSRSLVTAIPDIVSGATAVDISGILSSIRYLPVIRQAFAKDPGILMPALLQVPGTSGKLLPKPELVQSIFDAAGEAAEKYEPDKVEERVLEAGAVEERSTYYTGNIRVRDLVSVISILKDKLDNDADFRQEIISYLNGVFDLFDSNFFYSHLLYALPPHISYSFRSFYDLPYYTAIMTGKWEFTEEFISEQENEGTSGTDTESTAEDVLTAEDFAVEPGRTYRYDDLTYNDCRIMREGVMRGKVRLTGGYNVGDSLWIMYQDQKQVIEQALGELYNSVDEDLSVRLTSCFDEHKRLKGMIATPVQGEDELMTIQLLWPARGTERGFLFDVSAAGERLVRLRGEALTGAFHASFLVKDTIRAEAECNIGNNDAPDTLRITAEGSNFGATYAEAERKTEGMNDVYSGRVYNDEETYAEFGGYVRKESGDIDLSLTVPQYSGSSTKLTLKGQVDPESGDGRIRAAVSNDRGTYYSSFEEGSILIETEKLAAASDGSLSGSIGISQTLQSGLTSPIPSGLKLILDFDEQAVKIADKSGTYLSLRKIDSGIIDSEAAARRIREVWEESDPMRFGFNYRFGSNWNFGVILNRLMDAGMPADLLKGLPLTTEEIGTVLDEIGYTLDDFF